MARAVKQKITEELKAAFDGVEGFVVVDTTRFAAHHAEKFRTELRSKGCRMLVVNNSLAKRALEDMGFQGLGEQLKGQSAILFGEEGVLAVSRVLVPWRRKNKLLGIRCGYVDGRVVDPAEVDRLSRIPDRPQLLSMLLAGLQGPIRKLHHAVSDPIRRFSALVKALSDKKKEAEG